MEQSSVAPLVLTTQRATGSFSIGADVVASAPAVLELSVTKVVNPDRSGVGLAIYLVPAAGNQDDTARRILVGNPSLYPADSPNRFILRTSAAFQKLSGGGAAKPARLIVELQRLNEKQPWNQVELTIAPPKWSAAPK